MYKISEQIADNEMLTRFAAYLNMTADLQRIRQDEYKRKSPGFHLLYEWDKNKINSTREELVRIMKEIDLTSLAQMYCVKILNALTFLKLGSLKLNMTETSHVTIDHIVLVYVNT